MKTVAEIDEKLKTINKSLKPCPICKGKADIVGMHNTDHNIIIDAVGCMKCNLVLNREIKWLSNPKKLFSKRQKNTVNVVQTWNNRMTN